MADDILDVLDPDPLFDLDAALAAHAEARPGLPAGMDERVRAYDADITARLRAGDEVLQHAVAAWGATLKHNVELSFRYDLPQVVRLFLRHFQFHQRFRDVAFKPVVTWCETLDEFIAARLERYHLSPQLRDKELARLRAEAEERARRGGGTRGVYISGPGCFLNGWFFNEYQDGPASALLRMTSGKAERILETALHEALGHGFLAEYSALGAEQKALGVQDWEYARQFQFRALDTAHQHLLKLKLGRAFWCSRYLDEGWAMWVSTALAPALLGQPRAPRYTLAQVWLAVDRFPLSAAGRAQFRRLLHDLFLEPLPFGDPAWPRNIRLLQSVSQAPGFGAGLGQTLQYVLGLLWAHHLEARLGLGLVPYAFLIAGNVTFGLTDIPWTDLGLLVWDSRFNPDWRLAALSTLNLPQPVTLEALAQAARDQLNLAVPDALTD